MWTSVGVWVLAATVLVTSAAAHATCAGDCNGDGEATINEIIVGVNIALENAPASACAAADTNSDGSVTINELIAAVNQALNDCSGSPSPTPTPTPGSGPAGRLVFLWTDPSTFLGDIVAIESDGSGRTNLTNTATQSEGQPSWSPTGDRIVFTVDNTAVAVMNADGSGRRPVVTDGARVGYPAWSPDGTRLIFAAADFHSIDVVNVDGSNRRSLIAADGVEYHSPTYSPDGSRVAFGSNRVGSEGLDLYVMNADGSGVTRVAGGGTDYAETDWSARNVIAFGSFTTSAINPDGAGERPLVAAGGFPGWSASGDRFAFSGFSGLGYANADGSGVTAVPNTDFNDVDPDIR